MDSIPVRDRNAGRRSPYSEPLTQRTSLRPTFFFDVLLGILLICLFASGARAADLYLQGNFTKRVYFGGKTNDEPAVLFTVKIGACKWLINCVQNRSDYSPDYTEASYDGTNVYFLINIKQGVEKQLAKNVNMAPNIANARVFRGEVCNLETAENIWPVWLAYASGCYLASRTNDFVEPAFPRDQNSAMEFGPPNHYKMRAQWTLTDSPNFVSRLVYFNDDRKLFASGLFQKRPPPYNSEFTNSYYQVDTFTNIAGLSIPLHSSFFVFRTKAQATSSSDLDILFEYHISLTQAATYIDDDIFRPKIPGITVVIDSRVKSTNSSVGAVYYATNNWFTEEESLEHNLYARSSKQNFGNFFRIRVARVFLFVCFLVPGVVLLRKWFLERSKYKQKQKG